jgi:hypothetical protein
MGDTFVSVAQSRVHFTRRSISKRFASSFLSLKSMDIAVESKNKATVLRAFDTRSSTSSITSAVLPLPAFVAD